MAGRARDLAIHDAQIARLRHDAAARRPAAARAPPPSSIEPGQRDMVGAARRDQRRAAGEHEPRRAAHADDLRAGRQLQRAGPVRRPGRAPAARGPPRCGRSRSAASRSARLRRRRARRAWWRRPRSDERGVAAAGVASVAAGTAPVSAVRAIRRRRSILMNRLHELRSRRFKIAGQEMRAALAQDRGVRRKVNGAIVPQWDGVRRHERIRRRARARSARPPAPATAAVRHRRLDLRQLGAQGRVRVQAGEDALLEHRPHPFDLLLAPARRKLARLRQPFAMREHLLPELVDAASRSAPNRSGPAASSSASAA